MIKSTSTVQLVVSLFSITFVLLKAIRTPITYDEAYTYFHYAGRISNVLTIDIANNHPLNSLLICISTSIFGNSPLSIRLPSVVSIGVFLYAAFRLAAVCRSSLAVFCALVLNPYLLEFFALGRGYGIAAAFALLGFSFWIRDPDDAYSRVWSLLALSLAASAIFPASVMIAAAIAIFVTSDILSRRMSVGRFVLVLPFVAIFLLFVALTLRITSEGLPLYATRDPLASLASISQSYFSGGERVFMATLSLTVVLVGLASTFRNPNQIGAASAGWVVLILVGAIGVPLIVSAPLPQGRTVLPFVPALVAGLAVASRAHWRGGATVDTILAAVLVVVFAANAPSISVTRDWSHEWNIDEIAKQALARRCVVSQWQYNPALEYYIRYFSDGEVSGLPVCEA